MASTNSSQAQNEDPEDFNYNLTKRRYFNRIENNPQALNGPLLTRGEVETTIAELLRPQAFSRNMVVRVQDGKTRLYVKKKKQYYEVLSVEDAFDIVLGNHIACNHGDVETTHQALIKSYSLPLFCATWVVESCNVCYPSDNQETAEVLKQEEVIIEPENVMRGTGRGVWRLNIVEDPRLVKNPHSSVKYLMIYKENSSNFVILRPVFDSGNELALEIMKIFTEFGYPERVFVPNMLPLYTKTFTLLRAIVPAIAVPLHLTKSVEIFEKDKQEVLVEICKWMYLSNSIYWDLGCHIVQYKMNNTLKQLNRMDKRVYTMDTPFNLFFKYNADLSIESEASKCPNP